MRGGFFCPEKEPRQLLLRCKFFGRPWTEGLLIEIGYAYEQGTKNRRLPVTTPKLAGEM